MSIEKSSLERDQPAFPEYLPFFELNPKNQYFSTVKEKITAQDHTLFVLMHPFFIGGEKLGQQDYQAVLDQVTEHTPNLPQLQKVLEGKVPKRLLERMASEELWHYILKLKQFLKTHPTACILLAEETAKVEESTELLRSQGFTGTILAYPTMESTPEPDIRTSQNPVESLQEKIIRLFDSNARLWQNTPAPIENKKWKKIAEMCQTLGVKNVIVGGEYSQVARDLKSTSPDHLQYTYLSNAQGVHRVENSHAGCVGRFMHKTLEAASNLPTHEVFTVSLSSIAFPESHLVRE